MTLQAGWIVIAKHLSKLSSLGVSLRTPFAQNFIFLHSGYENLCYSADSIISIKPRTMKAAVKLTPGLRIASFLLLGISLVCFSWFGCELLSYILYPMFDAPSLAGKASANQSNYLWNVGLFGIFFLQHYIMASFAFKRLMGKLFPLYPPFERYVFNIVSFLNYRTIIRLSLISNTELFQLPKAIYALEVIGLAFFSLSVLQMFSNLLIPISVKQLW